MPKTLVDLDPALIEPRLPVGNAHVGVYNVLTREAFAARNRDDQPSIALEHAQLFVGGQAGSGILVKDRYVCYWFHTPHSRSGLIQGYEIDWSECNILIRLDPRWDYTHQKLLPAHQHSLIEENIHQQTKWGGHIARLYREAGLTEIINVHMIGPRKADTIVCAHRIEIAR